MICSATYPVLLFFLLLSSSALLQEAEAACPLDFSILKKFKGVDYRPDNTTRLCKGAQQHLQVVLSYYLQKTGRFLPPTNDSEDCWDAFKRALRWPVDIRTVCGFKTAWIAQGADCMNITTRKDFEDQFPKSARDAVESACNLTLTASPCASCTTTITSNQALHLRGPSVGNLTDCTAFVSIYATALLNRYGPLDSNTAWCVFFLHTPDGKKRIWPYAVAGSVVFVCFLSFFLGFVLSRRRKRMKKKRVLEEFHKSFAPSRTSTMNPNSTLVRFSIEEIRAATNNFSRDNMLGAGGFGNVYKAILPDGSVVAVKRFKNFSATGDSGFVHEVEVIASIRHRNLVSLKGFCVSMGGAEGHQRILVCEFMPNGSLHDHLFEKNYPRLDWPTRCQIALGMAKGLAYLHFEVQPAIIHRDIKASNILLDENFDAKLADFGLAKFAPEGVSHVTTRVAGTLGYLAPEYALYGQLAEKSDVYSFGVVLLELISGRKALPSASPVTGTCSAQPEPTVHITDWAWSLVRRGNGLDVIEKEIENPGSSSSMERYVYIALLCAHPQLYCRPSMDQVLKILESEDVPVPRLSDRPIPLITDLDDIERSMSGNSQLSSASGYQSFGTEGQSNS